MGKRGPAPKPTALRVLHGDRKDRINTAEPKPDRKPSPPKPPDHLSTEEKRLWREYAKVTHDMGVLTVADRAELEIFVVALGIFRRAQALCQGDGELTAERGASPAYQVLKSAAEQVDRFGSRFGLHPSARSELHVSGASQDDITEGVRRFS